MFHMVHKMAEWGMECRGVVSVSVDLFRAVACLFLGLYSIFFKPLKILSLTFFIFVKFFLYDFLTFKIRCYVSLFAEGGGGGRGGSKTPPQILCDNF